MPSTSSTKKSATKTSTKKATSTAKKTTKTPTKTAVKKTTTSAAKKTTTSTKKTPTKTTVNKSTTSTPKKTVKDTTPELKTRVAKAWYGASPQAGHNFEHFCYGYLTRHRDKFGIPKLNPKKTKDGGVDIISIKEDCFGGIETVYYVSVKNSKNKIKTKVIDELWGAMKKFMPKYDDWGVEHVAVVITSGEFTSDAIAQAKKSRDPRTILIDGHKIDKDDRVD